jgi:hypothetical protein
MALAIATNFWREARKISWKASTPWISGLLSARLWDWCLDDLQAFDRTLLFCPLKTCKGVLTAAAARVRPLKLADVNA